MGGGNGEGRVPALLQGFRSAGGRGEDREDGGDLIGELEEAGSGVGRRDLEVCSDLLWDTVGPEAVVIDVREKIVNLGRKTGVGRIRRRGVILTLKRVSKEDNGGERRVSGNRQVKIPARHFVDFVDNKEGGSFGESGLPSGHTPVLLGGEVEELFPLGPEFSGGDGDAKVLAKVLSSEHAHEREGLAAPSEAGEVD